MWGLGWWMHVQGHVRFRDRPCPRCSPSAAPPPARARALVRSSPMPLPCAPQVQPRDVAAGVREVHDHAGCVLVGLARQPAGSSRRLCAPQPPAATPLPVLTTCLPASLARCLSTQAATTTRTRSPSIETFSRTGRLACRPSAARAAPRATTRPKLEGARTGLCAFVQKVCLEAWCRGCGRGAGLPTPGVFVTAAPHAPLQLRDAATRHPGQPGRPRRRQGARAGAPAHHA
jgi:hypothetical protein